MPNHLRAVKFTKNFQKMASQGQGAPTLGSSLRRLKASSREKRNSVRRPPANAAAASHELNDKYMDTMEEAFRTMYSKENM